MYDSRSFVEKALRSGARGYVLKESATEEVIKAVHEVYRDRFYLSPEISKVIVDGFLDNIHDGKKNKKIVCLTKRERELFQLIAEGFTDKAIAGELKLSLNTVHAHRKSMMQKLDIHRLADLIRYAIKEGISKL